MKKVKNDIKLESTIFIRSWKIIVFLLLILVEILIGVINRNNAFFEIAAWQVEVPVFAVLTIENAVKMWGIRSQKAKIPFYVFDTLALIVLTLFTDGDLVSTLYIVILSEFYLTEERMTANIAMGASSVALFLIASAISGALLEGGVDVLALVISLLDPQSFVTDLSEKPRDHEGLQRIARKQRDAEQRLSGVAGSDGARRTPADRKGHSRYRGAFYYDRHHADGSR